MTEQMKQAIEKVAGEIYDFMWDYCHADINHDDCDVEKILLKILTILTELVEEVRGESKDKINKLLNVISLASSAAAKGDYYKAYLILSEEQLKYDIIKSNYVEKELEEKNG